MTVRSGTVELGTPGQRMWARFQRHRMALASGAFLAGLVVLAAGAPALEWLLSVDGNRVDLYQRFQMPSLAHPLGTDELGRDLLVRLAYGGQVSLSVALVAALFSAVIGTAVGLSAGYFGGRLDAWLMRRTDGVIALPLLPLLIVLVAVDLGKLGLPEDWTQSADAGLYRIIAVIALFGWTTVARLVRAETLALKPRGFVRAAAHVAPPQHGLVAAGAQAAGGPAQQQGVGLGDQQARAPHHRGRPRLQRVDAEL